MKQYRITLEGHSFDVKVLDDPRREHVRVEVDGKTLIVGVKSVPVIADSIAKAIPATPSPTTPPPPSFDDTVTTGSVVAAPLPGVIKSITVRPGQQVTPNDELLVIEAMKMDNIIRATRGGTIGTIYITEGRQVAYGETLLDFAD